MAPPSHEKQPDKRRKYDDAFKAEALRLARKSRSTRAAARQLGIGEWLLYRWQEQQAAAELGSAELARDPEVRALRAELQRVQRERDILKKALAMSEELVSEALRRALAVRQPAGGLIVHSDQGSQYTATRFGELLTRHGAVPSMSRRGNCYDNAQAESFWSRLKTELLDGGSFPDLEEARLELAHYIAYYNDERRHSALAYSSPNHFETRLQSTSEKCPA